MSSISFKINGKGYEVNGTYGPDVSLNEFIRTVADLRGTKVMCQEGGCGACVVAVRSPSPITNEVKTFSVNSCLVSVLSCHGWEVITVEGIGNRTMGYHEIQTRLANFNGTQCGYCTPGFVMNMYSLYESKNKDLTSVEVENSFASNICRCTGYRPIADAFKSFAKDADKKVIAKLCDLEDLAMFKQCGVKCKEQCDHEKMNQDKVNDRNEEWCVISKIDNTMIVIDCGEHKWFKAYNLKDVFDAMNGGDYKLVAGNTGQGVYHVTEYPKNIIDISNISELRTHMVDMNLVLGAGLPLAEMMEIFLKLSEENEDFGYLKQLHDHMDLVAHVPVRNIGTIGGNLFLKHSNNEFPSDLFLIFETVGAMITVADSINSITISLQKFLKADMKGKIIINVLLPPLSKCCNIKTYKIMPRSQNAHAIVNAGFLFKFHHGSNILEQATLVFGGLSPKFMHAVNTENFLVDKDPFTDETLQMALKSLSGEIFPEDLPPEPSAGYRKTLSLALYYKAILSLCPDDKLNPIYRSGGEVIKRDLSQGSQIFDTDKSVWPLNQPIPKLEALFQSSGEATFANDLPKQTGEVFAAFVTADITPGSVISSFDVTEALRVPGVIAFYSANDIPGKNTFTPKNIPFMTTDEEIFCSDKVKFYGQPVGVIVADREKTANKAAKIVQINYSSINSSNALVSIDDVMLSSEKNIRVINNATVEPTDNGFNIKHVIIGEFKMEGQYHFTMETQTCVVKPTEDGIEVYSSTQWLDLTCTAIANCLKVPINYVNVIVRRVGGSYGGKISRSSQIACAAALVTHLQGKTCRFVLPIETNMGVVGKRLPTQCQFEVGVDNDGEIQYLKNSIYQDCGHSFNEIMSPVTVIHFPNCYDSRRWYIQGNSVQTDTASNTWCRAPSTTEGVAMIEYIMEKIAFTVRKDPTKVRQLNMKKEDNPIPQMTEKLQNDSNYFGRIKEIQTFNQQNRWRKRAIKMLPLSVDIFYLGNFNAIVSIYHGDGSIVITHGGIEMGQGINTKTAQVCAYVLGVPLEKISVKPSSSVTSPNAMTTGGSIGSESVAFATMKACEELLKRLEPYKTENENWEQLIAKAYAADVDLQASYMFSNVKGDATEYKVFAVAIIEVEVDILTGNHDVRRVDLLEDTGRSLSPEIDVAQIEGAFVMGLGYWTSEQLKYDKVTGRILTDRTWNYKPPGIKDIPADMRIYFRRNVRNEHGVLQSKATGEPSLCLATAIVHALREAVYAARLDAGHGNQWLDIEIPCTVENIFMAVGHKLEDFKLM